MSSFFLFLPFSHGCRIVFVPFSHIPHKARALFNAIWASRYPHFLRVTMAAASTRTAERFSPWVLPDLDPSSHPIPSRFQVATRYLLRNPKVCRNTSPPASPATLPPFPPPTSLRSHQPLTPHHFNHRYHHHHHLSAPPSASHLFTHLSLLTATVAFPLLSSRPINRR